MGLTDCTFLDNSKIPSFRGTVSALGLDGHVIKKRTKSKDSVKCRNISNTVRCSSLEEDKIRESIVDAAYRLINKNGSAIFEMSEKSINRNTITPVIAFSKYGERAIKAYRPEASPETRT